ncbi:hypothetical protein Dimus_010469 [Dionaea muscipula]
MCMFTDPSIIDISKGSPNNSEFISLNYTRGQFTESISAPAFDQVSDGANVNSFVFHAQQTLDGFSTLASSLRSSSWFSSNVQSTLDDEADQQDTRCSSWRTSESFLAVMEKLGRC